MDSSKSSLPYQIFLALSKWFLPFFAIVESLLFLFKILTLPYPSGNIASEVCLLVFFVITEYGRLMSGERGNLTEKPLFVCISIILSGPVCTTLLYILLWQTYVLRIERVLVMVAMVLQGVQLLLALVTFLTLSRGRKP